MASIVSQPLRRLRELLSKAGPYLLIEILLPGGTLIALLFYLYQRSQGGVAAEGGPPFTVVYAWALGKLRDVLALLPTQGPAGPPRSIERDGLEPLGMAPDR